MTQWVVHSVNISYTRMIPLEVVPFAAAVPAFSITLTAVGMMSKDGAVLLAGIICQAATGMLLLQVL